MEIASKLGLRGNGLTIEEHGHISEGEMWSIQKISV